MEPTPPNAQMKAAVDEGANNRNTNNAMRSPPNKKDSRKLFVGGLPADITAEEFRLFFEQFGTVVDSVVMFDRETQRSRGFGFVTFQSSEVSNMLLNMGQGEDENGAEESPTSPRVGRLVMRGKTCEVKSAEPKESSRSNRRYQNQGGSGSNGGAAPNRRFVDKASYPPQQQGNHLTAAAHAVPYHDPHQHMAVAHHHQHPLANPAYYPAYHPSMYHGTAGYHPAAMYAPGVAHATSMHVPNDGIHLQPVVPPGPPVMDGAHLPPYMEVPYDPHAYAAAYGHQQMTPMQQGYPQHPSNMHAQPVHPPLQGAYPASGAPSSVMQPAAPGIPTKDEKNS